MVPLVVAPLVAVRLAVVMPLGAVPLAAPADNRPRAVGVGRFVPQEHDQGCAEGERQCAAGAGTGEAPRQRIEAFGIHGESS